MTQVENRTTSLAQQLDNAGFTRTSIATAVAELVGSWLGAQHIDGKLLKQLQITNIAVAGQLAVPTSGTEDLKTLPVSGVSYSSANDERFSKAA